MANNKMPFIAIIGGFWMLKDPAVDEEAKKTAREIGAVLANAGMGLVVYFSNDKSLEPHVVSVYAEVLLVGTGAESIRLRFAEPQKKIVKFSEQATTSIFIEETISGQRALLK